MKDFLNSFLGSLMLLAVIFGVMILIFYGMMVVLIKILPINHDLIFLISSAVFLEMLYLLFAKALTESGVTVSAEGKMMNTLLDEDYASIPALIHDNLQKRDDFDGLYEVAFAYTILCDYPKAIQLLKDTLTRLHESDHQTTVGQLHIQPQISLYYGFLASIYTELKDFDTAKHYLDQALAHQPIADAAYIALADWHLEQGQLDEAEAMVNQFERVHADYQKTHAYWSTHMLLALARGNISDAQNHITQYRKLAVRPMIKRNYHYLLGRFHQAQGDFKQAHQAYETLLAAPQGTYFHENGAKALRELQELHP